MHAAEHAPNAAFYLHGAGEIWEHTIRKNLHLIPYRLRMILVQVEVLVYTVTVSDSTGSCFGPSQDKNWLVVL